MKNENNKEKEEGSIKRRSRSRSWNKSKNISKNRIAKKEDKDEFRTKNTQIKSSIFPSKENNESSNPNIFSHPISLQNTIKTSISSDNISKQFNQSQPQIISSEKELNEISTQIHYGQEEAPVSYEGFKNKGII